LLCQAGATTLIALIVLEPAIAPQPASSSAKIAQILTTAVQTPHASPPISTPAIERPQQAAIVPPPQLTPAPVTAPSPAPPTDAGKVVTRQGANVRDTPNGHTVLRTVPRGTILRVFARRDGWVQVGEELPMGWIYSNLLADAP
jgi:hypothetical protein